MPTVASSPNDEKDASSEGLVTMRSLSPGCNWQTDRGGEAVRVAWEGPFTADKRPVDDVARF